MLDEVVALFSMPELFNVVPPNLFRPLAAPGAPVYARALEQARQAARAAQRAGRGEIGRLAVGFSPRVVQEAGQMQTILSLVAAGIGVALIPASAQVLHSAGVVYKSLGFDHRFGHQTEKCETEK